jgi:hypothetical protein
MWELVKDIPLGRLSMRKYLRFATALLVVCFTYIFITAPLAHAADAEFDGDTLTYSGQQYSGPSTATGTNPPGIPKDAKYYTSVDAADSKKGSVIYFSADADLKKATTAQLRTGNYDVQSGTFSNLSPPKEISIGAATGSSSAESKSSCKIDGVGWLVCNMSKWIADGVDYLYNILTNFFIFEPLTTSTSTGSIYKLWDLVRNFANIAFVIGFLIIIYSQMMNNFISNYTVKKLLPRIIVAAILVNTSYWICAVGIDLSNILGVSVQDLFANLRASLGAAANSELPSWNAVTVGILSGSGIVAGGALLVATGGTVGGLAFLLLGALIPAIFAALVAVAILAARQALITILVVLAPLAFVAYLLPNTEEWFNRWRKLFTTLLVMFPAFSLIFGGSQVAGNIIIQNAGGDISVALLGLTVQIVPLFITPFLIKLSSGLMGTIAGLANDRSKGMFDRAKNWSNNNREYHRQKGFASDPRKGAGRFRPTNMARGLNNRSLKREEMTAGYKSLAAGNFTHTRAGRQVYGLNQDAEGRKHAGESRNFEAYKSAMATGTDAKNIRRRQDHHDAHVAKGRGEVYENALTQHAERDLQQQILNTPSLLDTTTRAARDKGIAEMNSKEIEMTGKAALQRHVFGDTALKAMNVRTVRLEKEAGSLENILRQSAEENWERITTNTADAEFNPQLRSIRLQEAETSQAFETSKKQWTELVENIAAKGGAAPTITSAADKAIADNMMKISQDSSIVDRAIESAKVEQSKNMSALYKASQEGTGDPTILQRAGGIGGEAAATRIYAKAKKEVVAGYMEAIDNSRSIISDYTPKQLYKLHHEGIDKNGRDVSGNDALVFAAMQELLLNKGNNWAMQKLRDDTATRYGMLFDEDTGIYYDTVKDASGEIMYDDNGRAQRGTQLNAAEVETRRDAQQLFADAAKKSPLKVANLSQTDLSDFESGTSVTNGEQAIIRDIVAGKFDRQKIAGLDVDELQRMVMVVRNQSVRDKIGPAALEKLREVIDSTQEDPMLSGSIKDRERGVMFALASYIDPAEASRDDADRELHYWWEKTEEGAIVRRHPGEPNATESQASVIPSTEYLRDQFLNSKERGPDGSL